MTDQFPECECFKTGDPRRAICRNERADMPLHGDNSVNRYRAKWGFAAIEGENTTPIKPKRMGMFQRGVSFAKTLAGTLKNKATTGKAYVSDDVRLARLAICQTCEHHINGNCDLCGCGCNASNRLTNKLAHPTAVCPAGKWGSAEAVKQKPTAKPTTPRNPSPRDTPTPIPATISDTRNLIYHIWPNNKTDAWRWNIKQLCDRIELFNGVRSIGIVTDGETASVDEVKAAFAGHRIDNWIIKRNDAKNREGVTFRELMETLPQDDSTTFYGHAKGVRHHAGSLTIRWAEAMYRVTLDDWQAVAAMLQLFPIAGSFKRYGDFKLPRNFRWHYSGTYFWFRNRDTFSRDWQRLQTGFFAQVEAWPANIYTATEAGCLFGDNAGDLYQEKELSKWESLLKLRSAGAPATVAPTG